MLLLGGCPLGHRGVALKTDEHYEAQAKLTLKHLLELREPISAAAEFFSFDRCLIAAIISRETGGDPAQFIGDHGHGCGPMQVDDRSEPKFCADYKAGNLKPVDGIWMGCRILQIKQREMVRFFPSITLPEIKARMIAAYNCGSGNVHKAITQGLDCDHYTAGGDYSTDVLVRANWLKGNGFFDSRMLV